MVPIGEEFKQLKNAYEKYAPRYEGDEQYDVRSFAGPILEQQLNHQLRKS
jgi:hypothetical protein